MTQQLTRESDGSAAAPVSWEERLRDGDSRGRIAREWRRIDEPHGSYRAEGFAVRDAEERLLAWALHWGDALQRAQFAARSKEAKRARSRTKPRFAGGDRVAVAFGEGIVLECRRQIGGANRPHWRYRIRLDDGAIVDAAESGVRLRCPEKNFLTSENK